eukprot:3241808-Pleurochrysis_carterae.AAC.1
MIEDDKQRLSAKYLVFGAGGLAVLSYLSVIETLFAIDSHSLKRIEGCVGCSAGAFATLAIALNMHERGAALHDLSEFMMEQVSSAHAKGFRFNGTSAFDIEHSGMGESIRASVAYMLELCGLSSHASLKNVQLLCRIRMVFVLTDLVAARPIYVDANHEVAANMPIAEVIAMSSAIPFLHAPVQLGDALVVDGGLSNSLPLCVFPPEETLVVRTRSTTVTGDKTTKTLKMGLQHVDVVSYVMLLKTCFTQQMDMHLDQITTVYDTITVASENDVFDVLQKGLELAVGLRSLRQKGVLGA